MLSALRLRLCIIGNPVEDVMGSRRLTQSRRASPDRHPAAASA
jgi:hypothetical protein